MAKIFENKRPVYKLNTTTGLVEETGEVIDEFELVNSFKSCALDQIVAKFLPEEDDDVKEVSSDNYIKVSSDLDYLTELMTDIDNIKSQYGLQDCNDEQLLQMMSQKKEILKDELKKVNEDDDEVIKDPREDASDDNL